MTSTNPNHSTQRLWCAHNVIDQLHTSETVHFTASPESGWSQLTRVQHNTMWEHKTANRGPPPLLSRCLLPLPRLIPGIHFAWETFSVTSLHSTLQSLHVLIIPFVSPFLFSLAGNLAPTVLRTFPTKLPSPKKVTFQLVRKLIG